MPDFAIRPTDVFDIIRRRKVGIFAAFTATFAFVMALFVVLPRTYLSEAVVHIDVSYFQNPLIGELVSQTHDPGELRSEREKVITTSLGVAFATQMGDKYGLFKTKPDDPARSVEIEAFLKQLDISPVTATQFKIKFKARNPVVADGVIHGALDAIREYMYANRVQMLEEFIGVLDTEATRAGDDQRGHATGTYVLTGPHADAAKARLAERIGGLKKRLDYLRETYNDQHPSVQGVKAEIAELEALESGHPLAPALTRRTLLKGGEKDLGELSIKDDLDKQRHLVNISLEMEKKDPSMSSYLNLVKEPVFPKIPFFPKLNLFLLFALVSGVMAATLGAAMMEFWFRSDVSAEEFSRRSKVELLGTIVLPEGERAESR